MNVARRVFEFLKMGSQAHARWDYEVSMSILKNRKKLLILLVLLLPICVVSFLEAGDMLGSKTAYAPAFYSTNIFLVSIAIGLCAGLITGCIGAGGGFVITPALMAAGVKGILAVGTDLFTVMLSGLYGAATYSMKGRVEILAVLLMLVGAAPGAQIGTIATKYIRGYGIRLIFGVTVVCAMISVVLKQLNYNTAAAWTVMLAVSAITGVVLVGMVRGAVRELAARKEVRR